jgi:aminotransferase
MDTTDPQITFDSDGICNHCHYFENNVKQYWFPDERGTPMLEKMIAEVREYGKGKRYDSIIGLSGGVDSSYLAVKVAEWGLRPLAVHVDAGWNSELAVKNIEQIVEKAGLDLVTHVVDWEDMRELQLSFLRSHVANQDTPQDHAFFAALYNYSVKENIKYAINGSNYATESILPQAWGYDSMDAAHVKAIHKQFGRQKLKNYPIVSFYQYFYYYPRVKGMTILKPLNYMHYSKTEAVDYLEKNYGWRYYGGKHYESRWTRFFQAYYLPTKFGYDKRKAHLASLVVTGEITRDQALAELEKPLYTENELAEDKAFIAKKLGISVQELDELVHAPPRHYSEYPTHEATARRFYAVDGMARNLGYKIKRAMSG